MLLAALVASSAFGATTIVSDDYTAVNVNSGFLLGEGLNSDINPPTSTRLTGTAAASLRYLRTGNKDADAYTIDNNRARMTKGAQSGRFTLSANGTSAYNFATALGASTATPADPVVYDVTIAMRNDGPTSERMTFALGTVEAGGGSWSFGLQIAKSGTTYNIYKRIKTAASGLGTEVNALITTGGSAGSLVNFLIRVTDAGAETAGYHSRVQVSRDDGTTWIYDTADDATLVNGWRFEAAPRYFSWDQAPSDGAVYYDNFSVVRLEDVSAALVSPPDNALNLGPNVTLTAAVSNSAPGDLTVTFYGRETPKPYAGSNFCIAVLPDTQNYAREAAGNGDAVKEMWFAQTDWIVNNRVSQNIVYVAHLGDIVQNGDKKDGNENLTEWRNATNAMYRLENPTRTGLAEGIPYGMAAGNHDQEPIGDEDGTTTHFNRYFGVSHFSGKSYYGDHYDDNNDSHYDVFSVSGLNFIVLYFEYGRYGSGVMDWANDALAAHPSHRAIAVTHYAGSDRTPSSFSTQGSAIYSGLKAKTNFFLMLGGHVASNGGEGSRSDTYLGRTIRTYISDFQGWMNGGNGYMRLMYFSPSNNTVTIKTYSPWLNQYQTDANSQMSFTYKMPLPSGSGSPGTPYAAVGTNTGVAPNTLSSCVWRTVEPKKTYDWYVKVADANGNSVTTSSRQFTTLTKFAPNAAPVASNQVLTVTGDAPVVLTLPASDPDGDPLTFEIISEPVNGLITDFDPDNGTVTCLPARGYRGVDRLTFQASDDMTNSQVATVVLNFTSPPDTNTNGLPDAWEALYGVTDPNADADGDGLNNLVECRSNTNPTNAASGLRILQVERDYTGEVNLVWASVGGTRYRVQYSDGETNGGLGGPFVDIPRPLEDEMDTAPSGEESAQSFNDIAPASGVRFYRIRLVP